MDLITTYYNILLLFAGVVILFSAYAVYKKKLVLFSNRADYILSSYSLLCIALSWKATPYLKIFDFKILGYSLDVFFFYLLISFSCFAISYNLFCSIKQNNFFMAILSFILKPIFSSLSLIIFFSYNSLVLVFKSVFFIILSVIRAPIIFYKVFRGKDNKIKFINIFNFSRTGFVQFFVHFKSAKKIIDKSINEKNLDNKDLDNNNEINNTGVENSGIPKKEIKKNKKTKRFLFWGKKQKRESLIESVENKNDVKNNSFQKDVDIDNAKNTRKEGMEEEIKEIFSSPLPSSSLVKEKMENTDKGKNTKDIKDIKLNKEKDKNTLNKKKDEKEKFEKDENMDDLEEISKRIHY